MQEKKQFNYVSPKYQTNTAEQTSVNLSPSEPQPIEKPEIRFFTDPKTVKKKTEASIIWFQVIFTALFCLLYKAAESFTPELYANISAYMEKLFRW